MTTSPCCNLAMLEPDARGQAQAPDYRALFESAPDLYLVLAPDLTIVAASDAFLHAAGTTREDVLGRGLFDVLHDDPDDPDPAVSHDLRESLARVLRDRVPDASAGRGYLLRRPGSS